MNPDQAFSIAVGVVPQWYIGPYGNYEGNISIRGVPHSFYSGRPLTPKLHGYCQFAEHVIGQFIESDAAGLPSAAAILREMLAIEWLKVYAPEVNWKQVLAYVGSLSEKTYENAPVTTNLIIRPNGEGIHQLDNCEYNKFTNPLTSSPYTYFLTNGDLQLIDYCEVGWSEIKPSTSYKFFPEFLLPLQSVMQNGDYSVHLTRQRDLIITRKADDWSGLLAARRKSQWKIYDAQTFKNTIVGAMTDNGVGCTLFEILFDLSFRRHGALLVFDPNGHVLKHVSNPECRLNESSLTGGRELVLKAARKIKLNEGVGAPVPNKRLLLEMAGIDGAIIFNKDGVTAVGAIIETHENATNEKGARSTAMMSAYYWGGYPAKVSADGEVTLVLRVKSGESERIAKIEWL